MGKKKAESRLRFRIKFSEKPVTHTDWEASERLLARLVARAIAAEHPEWFGKDTDG
jgi:hypothetical protein